MAERTTKAKKKDGTRGSKASQGGAKNGARRKHPSFPLIQVLGRVLPVMALVVAFCAAVMLYRKLLPPVAVAPATTEVAVQEFEDENASSEPEGLEDPWLESKKFSTGNETLDGQVKAFCDAYTVEGYTARENANSVYNAIAWSTYQGREGEEGPTGNGWDTALAKQYFTSGDPASGVGGVGDVYDFSAAISFCMRYFGYKDALAVPVVKGDEQSGTTKSAVVLLTDENNRVCVCDPSLWGEGWMVDASTYSFTIENIGQDTTAAEAFGFEVAES